MNVTVVVNRKSQVLTGETVEEILEQCGYTIESVIVLKNGEVTLEEEVTENDTIELIPVASGG